MVPSYRSVPAWRCSEEEFPMPRQWRSPRHEDPPFLDLHRLSASTRNTTKHNFYTVLYGPGDMRQWRPQHTPGLRADEGDQMHSRARRMLRPRPGDAPLLSPPQAIPQLIKASFFPLFKKPTLKFCPYHPEKEQGEPNLLCAPGGGCEQRLHQAH